MPTLKTLQYNTSLCAAPTRKYADLALPHKFCVLCLLFFISSFVGWALETIGFYLTQQAFYERGFLWLPFCPLYGFSLSAIYLIMRTPMQGVWRAMATRPRSKALQGVLWAASFVLYAIVAAVLATLTEYLTGLFYHKIYGIRLWDYRGYPSNIGGYIVIDYSLLWGVGAAAAMSLMWYPVANVLARVDYRLLAILAITLTFALSVDFIFNMSYLAATGRHYPFFPEYFIQVCRLRTV